MIQQIFDFFKDLDAKHVTLLFTSISATLFAIYQFRARRKQEIKDKLFEKRHAAYKTFITKLDDMAKAARIDPTGLLKVVGEQMSKVILAEDEQESMQAIADMSSAMYSQFEKILQPLLVAKSEINALMLDCSDQMLEYVNEYRILAQNTIDEIQNCLDVVKPENMVYAQEKFQNMDNKLRAKSYDDLTEKMIQQMRKELKATYS